MVSLKILSTITEKGFKVNVDWFYEEDDEDMLEAGEDYQAIIRLPFKIFPSNERDCSNGPVMNEIYIIPSSFMAINIIPTISVIAPMPI